MNEERLDALLGRVLNDLGGAYTVPLVRMGEHSGTTARSRRTAR